LEDFTKELDDEKSLNRHAESKLTQKVVQMEQEKAALAKQRQEIKDAQGKLIKDRESMATLDKFLHRRGQELDEREKTVKKNGNGKVYSLYEQQSSQVLEDSLEEERKLMEETAGMLSQREVKLRDKEAALKLLEESVNAKKGEVDKAAAEADEKQRRIRSLAQQLRRKESEIEEKEISLSAEYEQYQGAHSRVQQMARELQKKEGQMSSERQRLLERLQECDALESQLSDWQTQLEDASAGGVISVSSNTSGTSSPDPKSPESSDRHFFGRDS